MNRLAFKVFIDIDEPDLRSPEAAKMIATAAYAGTLGGLTWKDKPAVIAQVELINGPTGQQLRVSGLMLPNEYAVRVKEILQQFQRGPEVTPEVPS